MFINKNSEGFQIFLGISTWTLCILFGLPFVIVFSVWKLFAEIYIKIKYWKIRNSRPISQPNMQETFFGLSGCSFISGFAFVGDEKIELKRLRTHFYNTFIKDGKDLKVRKNSHDLYVIHVQRGNLVILL
jgi:hypothetical protein